MKREAVFCSVLVVLLLVSVFHMAYLQLPVVKGAGGDQRVDFVQPRTIEHRITGSELQLLKSRIGVGEEGQNYNQIVYGYGTGLAPPSEADWEKIGKEANVVDQVSSPASLSPNVDNSATSWFPPIGNQGSQGSCVAWAVGYYTKTFQEAKEHSWSLSGTTTKEIMSPSFIYNLINFGVDGGSYYSDAINLVCSVGDCSLAKMPYNAADYTSWPSEQAWREAPLYRGADQSFSYMILQNDSDLANLKSWLASGNLAIVSVDASKIVDPFWGWSLLDSNDMLTLDNYINPSPNHAGTIVGYNDNFAYTEQGQTHYGAFKIANSWGVGGWERVPDGFYWISYKAMEQRVQYCMFYRDRIGYEPTLTCSFELEHPMRGECSIVIGMGTHDYPTVSKIFTDYIHGGNHVFCPNNIVFDITEFENAVPNVYGKPFFLSVYDGGSSATGTILYFSVGNTVSSNPPVNTVNGGYVFADLTLVDEPHNADAMWVEPSAVNFSASSTSVGFKFNVTVAMNFTENVFAWQAVLYYNATQLNCTRVGATAAPTSEFMTGHSTTFSKAINSGAYPPVGDLKSVLAAETCSSPDFVTGPHSGTLFWAEFQIMLAPGAGQTFNSKFDISTEYALTNTYVWDTFANAYTFTPYDGTYQYSSAHVELFSVNFYVTNNPGATITFSGTTYTSGQIGQYAAGNYSALANISSGYSFYCWGYSGGVEVMGGLNPTTVQVTDNGSLDAALNAQVTFYTSPGNVGTIRWGADSPPDYTNGQSTYDYFYYNTVYVKATNVPGYTFDHWTSTWSLTNATTNPTNVTFTGPGWIEAYYVKDKYLVVRGNDNGIYCYDYDGSTWNGWIKITGSTFMSPAATVFNNKLQIVVVGTDNRSLWYGNVDLGTSSFSGWTKLSGSTPSAPTLTSNGTELCLVVRGMDNRIYCSWYTSSWGPWQPVPIGTTADTSAVAMLGNDLHIIVRGMDGLSLWDTIVNYNGTVARGWLQLSGATSSRPVLASHSSSNKLYLVVRGSNNLIYYQAYNGSTDSWQGWTFVPGATLDGPAATVANDNLYIAVRGTDGNTLWYGYVINPNNTNNFSGWTLLNGSTPSTPTLAS